MKTAFVMLTIVLVASLVSFAGENALAKDELTSRDGAIVIHPVVHASFVMQWNSKTIYVDPVDGADLYARFEPADLVLITHTHGDHLDVDTLEAVVGEGSMVVAPAAVAAKLPDGLEVTTEVMANGESIEALGANIEAVPMYNLSEERLKFHPKGVGNGYVVTLGGTRLYIAGDTEGIPEMRALENIDAAFVCMNLPFTMDVEHAADAVLAFAPKVVYPYHYRGRGGMSDLGEFERRVAANSDIDVRRLRWY